MAIGPSDENVLGTKPRRPGLPATFETNPVRSGAPGQGPAPITPPSRPMGGPGRSGAGPSVSNTPPPPELSLGQVAGAAPRLAQGVMRPETLPGVIAQPVQPNPFQKGGSMGLVAPGLTARERGQEVKEGVKGIAQDTANQAKGAWNSFAAASDAVLRPVGEFAQGALGIEPAKPSMRETLIAAQAERVAAGRPTQQVGMVPSPAPVAPTPAPKPVQTAPGTQQPSSGPVAPQIDPMNPPRNTFIGADGMPRSIDVAPGLAAQPAPLAPLAAAQPATAPAPPALPGANVPTSVARADPSRTAAGDEATRSVMQEIQSQMFRNSFGAGRGERSARALQGQLTQALSGLAPTLGASADAADARNVQAQTAMAQTQAQQQAAQLQAQTASGINERRAQAAELVAQIGAGARPPTLITGEQGAFSVGPGGQAVPLLAPDGSQVKPSPGGGQGVRPDTLFKEFNGRLASIQSDPTLSPEMKQQQMTQLYADPLFQGLAQYLQPGQ